MPPAPRPPRRGPSRLILWLATLGVVGLGVWGLYGMFPGRITTTEDWGYLARGVAVLGLVLASVIGARRMKLKDAARNLAIWIGVFGVVVLGVAYRGPLGAVAMRVRSELIPGYAAPAGDHAMALSEDADGSFHVVGRVNGQPVNFLVDTGASDIVLSPADASRLGIDPATLRFTRPYETANGIGQGAAYTAASLEVGKIRLSNVAMSINQAPMSTSLLGMTFLKRIDSFEIKDGQLILKWRG
jgi:aspartyl protease family protein